ncbi:MAG: glycosyltransferase [Chryseobacterium sp.]|nr:glycosyltransferase [Chryseobacterium sp.]
MKKIFFFIESLEIGGAEKSLLTLLHSFNFKNYEIDLMMLKEGTFLQDVPAFVNIIFLEELRPSYFKRLKYFISKKIKLKNLHPAQYFWQIYNDHFNVYKTEYDIAIAYSQGFSTYFVAEKITAKIKFAWLNTDYKKAGYQIAFDHPFYEKFTKIIAVSTEAKLSLEKELMQTKKELEIEIIKDIVDTNFIISQANQSLKIKFEADKINIVSVGRLVVSKGFNLAVEACAILLNKGYKINWYIVGEGVERKHLQRQIKEQKLERFFFLLGEDLNPYPYIKSADIYVQTSLFEGLGLSLIEAKHLSKQIVTTDFAGSNEIIQNNETGLIAEINSVNIACKIQQLIENPELKNQFSANLAKLKNIDKELSLLQIEKLIKNA